MFLAIYSILCSWHCLVHVMFYWTGQQCCNCTGTKGAAFIYLHILSLSVLISGPHSFEEVAVWNLDRVS